MSFSATWPRTAASTPAAFAMSPAVSGTSRSLSNDLAMLTWSAVAVPLIHCDFRVRRMFSWLSSVSVNGCTGGVSFSIARRMNLKPDWKCRRRATS